MDRETALACDTCPELPPSPFVPVSGFLFQASLAVDATGQVAAYTVEGPDGPEVVRPFVRVLLVDDRAAHVCALEYMATRFGAEVAGVGDTDATLDPWLDANGRRHGFVLEAGGFDGSGPTDVRTGQPCALDPAIFSEDPVAGFLGLEGAAGRFRVGIGGALDGDAEAVVAAYAGQSGYPAAVSWFGGSFQLPFRYTGVDGGATDQSSAAVHGRMLGDDMIARPDAPVLAPEDFAPGEPLPRGVYTVVPSVTLRVGP
ncbi:MAG: hypothetical protein H6732_18410 [Alphaproteobacteria bacterium]|nr:hypothetical protein [Alphaproteobacteria bacterium]